MKVFDHSDINKSLAAILFSAPKSDKALSVINESAATYGIDYDSLLQDDFKIMALSASGITQDLFYALKDQSPFSIEEWALLLHISKRTIIRYKNDKKSFNSLSSDRIIELTKVIKRGVEVFGDRVKFNAWIRSNCYALGNVKPMYLMKNATGIQIILDQIGRIEHGILA